VTQDGELGLRFTATWARADYDAIVSVYGASAVRVGLLITPMAYVQMANGIFTHEALSAMVAAKGSASGAAYVEILMPAIPAGDSAIVLSGTLYKFSAKTFANDPFFAAVAFTEIDTDGDGTFDKCVYGSYDASLCASVKTAFTAVRPSVSAKEQAWIDTLIAKFTK